MITRQQIEERKAQLAQELQKARDSINAIDGAMQDCDFWLSQLPEEEKLEVDYDIEPGPGGQVLSAVAKKK
jgi:hypothetical protein